MHHVAYGRYPSDANEFQGSQGCKCDGRCDCQLLLKKCAWCKYRKREDVIQLPDEDLVLFVAGACQVPDGRHRSPENGHPVHHQCTPASCREGKLDRPDSRLPGQDSSPPSESSESSQMPFRLSSFRG